jgi:hypothetical protein
VPVEIAGEPKKTLGFAERAVCYAICFGARRSLPGRCPAYSGDSDTFKRAQYIAKPASTRMRQIQYRRSDATILDNIERICLGHPVLGEFVRTNILAMKYLPLHTVGISEHGFCKFLFLEGAP